MGIPDIWAAFLIIPVQRFLKEFIFLGLSYAFLCFYVKDQSMKVTIKSWTGVATWRWIANEVNCDICRMPFDSCYRDCKLPGDNCPLVWGACSHCFHINCIVKWFHSQPQQQCPMCRQDWKFNNK